MLLVSAGPALEGLYCPVPQKVLVACYIKVSGLEDLTAAFIEYGLHVHG